ncbi:MAG TPA: hypothetical protein VLA43_11415 [Longimicrobiales bacterium]|nr:hypothetical protein [Longimicrobiales bacterium]
MKRFPLLALVAFAAACGEMPTESPEPMDLPLGLAQIDGSYEKGGFYWLSPTVRQRQTEFGGTFDAGLLDALAIKFCDAAGDPRDPGDCASVLYTLSATSQPEIIRLDADPEKENYSVTWQSTNGGTFTAGNTYRAFVTVAHPSGSEVVLGYLDLYAAATQRDLRGQTIGFVQGSPFLFKFRIEEGIPGVLAVSPGTAELFDSDTQGQSQGFTATLSDLHGDPLVGRTVQWTANSPLVTVIPSSGDTDGSGGHSTTVTPADRVGEDTDVTITASHEGVSGTAVLTLKPTICSLDSSIDSDGDRLPDCAETNTGVFVEALNTGTDPLNPDTDGDAIRDGDEVLGTTAGLNLPALGVNPLRKDLLLEYDWFDDSICGSAHSHRPTAATVGPMTAAFASAPVANPDGSTGINVINDYGQGGVFTGGNFIADADGVIAGTVFDADFQNYKAANLAANRVGYFHYVMMIHSYNTNSGSSGYAEINGDDLIVSLNCYGTDLIETNTIMHELGHNIGLRHGGGTNGPNYKPNYNSVMNYQYQFSGVDNNCVPWGDGVTDFSRGTRPALDESALNESLGLCGAGPAWDWSGNGVIDGGTIARSINGFNGGPIDNDNTLSVLTDYDDWGNLNLGGLPAVPGSGALLSLSRTISQVEGVSCPAPPWVQ